MVEAGQDVELDAQRVRRLALLLWPILAAHVDEGGRVDPPDADRAGPGILDGHRPERDRVVDLLVVRSVLLREVVLVPQGPEVAAEHRLRHRVRRRVARDRRRQVPTARQDERGHSVRELGSNGTGEGRAPRVPPDGRPVDARGVHGGDDVGRDTRPAVGIELVRLVAEAVAERVHREDAVRGREAVDVAGVTPVGRRHRPARNQHDGGAGSGILEADRVPARLGGLRNNGIGAGPVGQSVPRVATHR